MNISIFKRLSAFCQVALYAGLNDKLTSCGIYEYDPLLDYNILENNGRRMTEKRYAIITSASKSRKAEA